MTTKGQTVLTPAKGSTNEPNWHDKTHARGCWYVERSKEKSWSANPRRLTMPAASLPGG